MFFQKKLDLIFRVFLVFKLEQTLLKCSGAPSGSGAKETSGNLLREITVAPQAIEHEIQKELSRRWMNLSGIDEHRQKEFKSLIRDLLDARLQLNAAENIINHKTIEMTNITTYLNTYYQSKVENLEACLISFRSFAELRKKIEEKFAVYLKSMSKDAEQDSMARSADAQLRNFKKKNNEAYHKIIKRLEGAVSAEVNAEEVNTEPNVDAKIESKIEYRLQQCLWIMAYSNHGEVKALKNLFEEDEHVIFCGNIAQLWVTTSTVAHIPLPLMLKIPINVQKIVDYFYMCYSSLDSNMAKTIYRFFKFENPPKELLESVIKK